MDSPAPPSTRLWLSPRGGFSYSQQPIFRTVHKAVLAVSDLPFLHLSELGKSGAGGFAGAGDVVDQGKKSIPLRKAHGVSENIFRIRATFTSVSQSVSPDSNKTARLAAPGDCDLSKVGITGLSYSAYSTTAGMEKHTFCLSIH